MRKAYKLADRARRQGNCDAEYRHEIDALVHRREMEILNKAAASLIFKKKNKVRHPSYRDANVIHVQSPFSCFQDCAKGTIDLHGLFVSEALEYAEQGFELATLRADRVIRFIVGTSFNGVFNVCHSRRSIDGGST